MNAVFHITTSLASSRQTSANDASLNTYRVAVGALSQHPLTGEGFFCLMTRTIPLQGKHADGRVVIVDDDDFGTLSRYTWRAQIRKGYFYAVASLGSGKRIALMHRLLMSDPAGLVDHINGDTLDNRRHNLRVCSHAENMRNRTKSAPAVSQYKGVLFRKDRQTWYSTIQVNGKRFYVGNFKSEVAAAKAYDEAAKKLHGEFARLNFP